MEALWLNGHREPHVISSLGSTPLTLLPATSLSVPLQRRREGREQSRTNARNGNEKGKGIG
jgi:hypothetical protein